MNYRQVVTSFLTADNRILLLLRSAKVGTHRGKWSAVSGYLEGNEEPLQRAMTEIQEELGLIEEQFMLVRAGEVLRAFDEETDTVWVIHPFLFETESKTIQLDWENTEYRWVDPKELASYETVPKLSETFDRVRYNPQTSLEPLTTVLRGIDELGRDRVHGASFLGRRAVELFSAVGKTSDASDKDTLFSHLLFASSRLRRAQPAMANLSNLIGRLLHFANREREAAISVVEFKRLIVERAEQILETVKEADEDASRNTARLLPKDGWVLTHSYSSTVLRALELGAKSGKRFQVYATESYPGMEGKRLANDLVALGVPVKLIADSAVGSLISKVNVVLVGADSVLKDGSLIHKIGTRDIAVAAKRHEIPLYSACETMKFSALDFLGEQPEIPQDIFDATRAEYISSFITEEGELDPNMVQGRIREMLKELYS